MSTQIETLLTRSPDVRHGKLCVAGTTTTVQRIAVWYKMGYSPEEMARKFQHLPIDGIYAALAYYHANQAELEAEIAAEQAEEEKLEADWHADREKQQERVA